MVQNSIRAKNLISAYVYLPQEWSKEPRVPIQIEFLIKLQC